MVIGPSQAKRVDVSDAVRPPSLPRRSGGHDSPGVSGGASTGVEPHADARNDPGGGAESRLSGLAIAALVLVPLFLLFAFLVLLAIVWVGFSVVGENQGPNENTTSDTVVIGDSASGDSDAPAETDSASTSQSIPNVDVDQPLTPSEAIDTEAVSGDRPTASGATGEESGFVDEPKSSEMGLPESGVAEDSAPASSPKDSAPSESQAGASGSEQKVWNFYVKRPDPPPPPPKPISPRENPFVVEPSVPSVVYVVDKSGSMEGPPFGKVCRWMLAAMDALEPSQKFAVVFFDATAHRMPNWCLLPATDANRSDARDYVGSVLADGGTDPTRAIELALGLKPEVIIVLSDGEFSPEIVDRVTRFNQSRGRVEIRTCGLSSYVRTLEDLARRNRGNYKTVR